MLTYDTQGRQFRVDASGPDSGALDGAFVAALIADDVLVTVESEMVGVKQGDSANPSHAQLRIPRLDADRGFSLHVSGQPAQAARFQVEATVDGGESPMVAHVGRRA